MDENNPIKYSDLLQADDSFEKLLDLLEQVGTKYSALQSSIKASAEAIKQSLQGVNATTAQGQATISAATKQADALAKKERELASVNSELNKELIRKSAELKKAQRLAKLEQKLANAQEGSYDALSAQYLIIKERLNAMSAAERENTKEGQALVQQASELYKRMKVLQEETGKHTLSVGDYGIATVNLAADIRRAIQALTQMRLEGQAGSKEYQRLVQDLKRLKTQYSIVKTETQSLGSQTARLNQVMGALTSMSGALSVATSIVDDSESDWAQTLVKINKYIAITNGLMAFVNGLYKQSFLTNVLFNASKKAEIRARALNIAIIRQETKATWLQVAAQTALNLVAKANPFIALGTVIAAVAGGFVLLSSNTKKAARELNNYNLGLKSQVERLQQIANLRNQAFGLAEKAEENRIASLKESEASLVAVWEAETKLHDMRQENLNQDKALYANDIKNVDKNREILKIYSEQLSTLKELKAAGAKDKNKVTVSTYNETLASAFPEASILDIFNLDDSKTKVKLGDAIDILQGYVDTYQLKIDLAVGIEEAQKELDANSQHLVTEWRMIQRQLKDTELAERHAANTEVNRTIAERFAQQAAMAREESAEEIRILKQRLERDANLTVEARKALNNQIAALEKQLQLELSNIAYERRKAEISAIRASEDLAAKAEKDGFEKRKALIIQNYEREREDIQNEIKYNTTLTVKEREELRKQEKLIESAKNRELSDLRHEYFIDLRNTERETEDVIFDSKAESYAKQLEQLRVQHAREKEDLQDRLDFESLTAEQQKAIRDQIIATDKRYSRQVLEIQRELKKAILDNDKDLWSNRLSVLNEYTQDYLDAALKVTEAEKTIALAEFDVNAEKLGLTDEQRAAGRKAITDKYNNIELTTRKNHMQKLFDLDQELAESEFNIIQQSEYKKAEFTRKQEIARLRKLLELDEEFGNKLTEKERQIIRNRIAALENQPSSYESFYDLIGIPAEWKDLLEDLVGQILDAYKEILDARMELAEAQIQAAQEEVDMTKSALDAELQARANGYANNVALARREFEDAKKREREALEFKRKVEREQEAIDTITQISSLITATANFWSTSSKLGPIAGPIAAGLATAAMWTAFTVAKIKASQLRNEAATYGKGTVELLKGGSHASGRDISLGYTPDGRERRAEGGEYFAIINKRNSHKYGRTIEDVINAFNSGTFEKEFTRTGNYIQYQGIDRTNEPTTVQAIYSGIRDFTREFGRTSTTDISRLESDVSALREQMERREYVEPDGTKVIIYGNNVRRIKNG